MKKLIFIASAFTISAGILAAAFGSLSEYKSRISSIEAAKSAVVEKEKYLENLKTRQDSSLWNFIGRSSQEKSVQKRSETILEISALKDNIAAQTEALLKDREKLAQELKVNIIDKDFMEILDYMDSLMTDSLSGYEFIEDAAAGISGDKQAMEYLRYKVEAQAIKLQAMDMYQKYLIIKLKAVQEAKLTDSQQVIEAQLNKLKESRARGEKSQELLTARLNPAK